MDQQNPSAASEAHDLEAERIAKLKGEFLGGVSWFYWIGGLSLVNIVFGLLADRKFIVGLGITEVFDALAFGGHSIGYGWIAASVLVSALFVWLGFLGRKGKRGAILGGLVLYVLDGVLMAAFDDLLSALFHAYAAFMIFKGWKALKAILAAVPSGDGAAEAEAAPGREKSAV
jgi:hypothetical protein